MTSSTVKDGCSRTCMMSRMRRMITRLTGSFANTGTCTVYVRVCLCICLSRCLPFLFTRQLLGGAVWVLYRRLKNRSADKSSVHNRHSFERENAHGVGTGADHEVASPVPPFLPYSLFAPSVPCSVSLRLPPPALRIPFPPLSRDVVHVRNMIFKARCTFWGTATKGRHERR